MIIIWSPPRNRRRPAKATPPRAQVTARPRHAPQALGPGLRPSPWGSWNSCTSPAARLSDDPQAPTPAPAAGRACPPGQSPAPTPGTDPGPPTCRHSTEAGLQATPARPRAPKPSRWNDQRPRSWPLRLGAASSPRRAPLRAPPSRTPHTVLPKAGTATGWPKPAPVFAPKPPAAALAPRSSPPPSFTPEWRQGSSAKLPPALVRASTKKIDSRRGRPRKTIKFSQPKSKRFTPPFT